MTRDNVCAEAAVIAEKRVQLVKIGPYDEGQLFLTPATAEGQTHEEEGKEEDGEQNDHVSDDRTESDDTNAQEGVDLNALFAWRANGLDEAAMSASEPF